MREGDVPPSTQSETIRGEVELFGGEASPVPPSLDETPAVHARTYIDSYMHTYVAS